VIELWHRVLSHHCQHLFSRCFWRRLQIRFRSLVVSSLFPFFSVFFLLCQCAVYLIFSAFFHLTHFLHSCNAADLSTLIFRHDMMSPTLGANLTTDTPFRFPFLFTLLSFTPIHAVSHPHFHHVCLLGC
jgi:hypothetical protein